MTTPIDLYRERLKLGSVKPDAEQEKAALVLDRLFHDVLGYEKGRLAKSFLWKVSRKKTVLPPKGVYIHGGVGRGKSMLMDLLFGCLPDNMAKRRVHFHAFMIEVHDFIHTHRQKGDKAQVDQALPVFAATVAERAHVLCFDEFHVVDITDAMILARLFRLLFDHGVVVVATSNWPPDRLYEGGLQRDRLLPFISLLKEKVEVVHLDSPNDYRAQTVQIEGKYFTPLGKASSRMADRVFEKLTQGYEPKPDVIEVKGRKIKVDQAANGCARFPFSELCEKPHGAEDYIAITKKYHTVFLEGIPKLGYDRRNEAKRLMNLVDALYEARARVIITAATKPERLYSGDDHSYEFERTISRLLEMQSEGYP